MSETTWIYLTNAVGELTMQGSIEPDEAMLRRVPFESGPGHVRAYLVEIEGEPWVAGCLEVPFDHQHWTEVDPPHAAEPAVRAYCEDMLVALRPGDGHRVQPLDEDMEGRFEISVAVPLRACRNAPDARARLAAIYGSFAWLDGYPERVASPGPTPC